MFASKWLMLCWLAGYPADFVRVAAQGLPVQPILRIETGTHTGSIRSIDADAAERYLVSGSDDKTVRIWDLPSGKLLRVLRPPIGEANDGEVYAVAISPDGRTIACGGLTGSTSERISIYLFERASGRLYRRIGGLPEAIVHLAYSPYGRFLVASLGGKNGIRLYRTGDYAQVSEDRDYGEASFGADFAVTPGASVSNRLATSSFDGLLRLYEIRTNGSLRLITKKSAPGGARPSGVRFAPDGSRIAIGFSDAAQVNVLSPTDLSPICLPDTTGLNRSLNSVVWSLDGSFLYAAGHHMLRPGANPIIRWGDSGCGSRAELPGAVTTISSLRSMRDGGIVFGAGAPAIGIVNRQGEKRLFFGPPDSAELLLPSKLLVSSNGMRVCLADQPTKGVSTCFSVADRTVAFSAANWETSRPPLTEGLAITDWEISSTPKLKGKVLHLFPNERSRCLAIAPNRQQFLLGTDWGLRLFDRTGVQKWAAPRPSTPGAVNISGDGRLAIAVFSNGTIHWYRIEDGKELFSVFIQQDWKHWVLWTPSGYYDASPGGEELIGWHINNGRDAAADFFPVSRFRANYYRPDIVGRLLGSLDETEAIRLADVEPATRQQQESIAVILPPVVTIISPSDGQTAAGSVVKVRYRLRTPSGQPVTAIRVLVDGRPVGTPQRLKPADDSALGTVRRLTLEGVGGSEDEREIEVRIPERDCEFAVIAENRYSVSEPARVRLRWQGQARSETRSKLYVLAVGVSAYPPQYRLGYPAKDASDFASALGAQRGRLYSDIQTRLVTDEIATRAGIEDGLDWIEKSTTRDDVAIIYLAGHGVNDPTTGNYYFLPTDFDAKRLRSTAVGLADFLAIVSTVAGKVVFFLDTCNSGNVLVGRKGDINRVINELSDAQNGAVVFAASTGSQVALERPDWGNGAFTKALIEGLRGEMIPSGRGRITLEMLAHHISDRVKELTGGQQTPVMRAPDGVADFALAVR